MANGTNFRRGSDGEMGTLRALSSDQNLQKMGLDGFFIEEDDDSCP